MEKAEREALEQFTDSFFKILKINLTDDSFQIIKSQDSENTEEKGFNPKISKWLNDFCIRGNVYISDQNAFLANTGIDFLRDYFHKNDEHLRIRYRRAFNGDFRWCMLEMFKAKDYSEKSRNVYLFVQDLNKEHSNQIETEQRLLNALTTERLCMTMVHDLINSGMWSMRFDENGAMSSVQWSPEFRHMLGYSDSRDFPDTLESWSDKLHPDDKEQVLSEYYSTIDDYAGRKIFDVEFRIMTKNRGYRWFRAAGEISRRLDGSPIVFIGVFMDITEKKQHDELLKKEAENKKKLEAEIAKEMAQLKILKSMSEIYLTMHLIDLDSDTIVEYNSCPEVHAIVNKKTNAREQVLSAMNYMISDASKLEALEFSDLATVKERLRGKKIISKQLLGNFRGWVRADIISIDTDENEEPRKVVFTVTVIDTEKRREEKLIKISKTDEMTGLFNRRAYEEFLPVYEAQLKESDIAVISLDLNGLKTINDTMGHSVGDEMISGAASCIKKVFSKDGKCFRMGGDEFLVLISMEDALIHEKLREFDEIIADWKGENLRKLSVSWGCAFSAANRGKSLRSLIKIADEVMYEAKSAYYREKGNDRRRR